jgi:hypothetical protein
MDARKCIGNLVIGAGLVGFGFASFQDPGHGKNFAPTWIYNASQLS